MSRRRNLTGLDGCDYEQHVNLTLWLHDGFSMNAGYRRGKNGFVICRTKPSQPEVSIGRADSKRTLGFTVSSMSPARKLITAFVLDRDQCIALRKHLDYQIRRLKTTKRRRS